MYIMISYGILKRYLYNSLIIALIVYIDFVSYERKILQTDENM